MELPEERFKIIISKEANAFIASLPEKARFKILYNLKKATYFVDQELFKKLDSSEIWEFRTYVMNRLEFYSLDEVIDEQIGVRGSQLRAEFDDEIDKFLIGEAIKRARLSKNLTQEELGKMVGVQRAQISRIERGSTLSISTVSKVFRAMGISASIVIEGIGAVSLC